MRVRVGTRSVYQLVGVSTILPGVKGLGRYSLYPIGRMALDWTRAVELPVAYNAMEFNTTVHWQPSGSLNGWAAYGQSGALAQGGGEDFLLLRNEQPGARTDFLHILSQDWAGADVTGTFQIDGGGAQEWKEATWQDNTPGVLAANQSFRMLYYFKPTTLGVGASPWLDPAVTSRSADYRTPSTTVVGPGFGWVDASENTDADPVNVFFNEAEAAYVFDLDPASGLTFAMDGSTTTRQYPFFKIRRWQSFIDSARVSFDPDGGGPSPSSLLQPGRDYRAAVKPVTRAHLARDLLWYSTLREQREGQPPGRRQRRRNGRERDRLRGRALRQRRGVRRRHRRHQGGAAAGGGERQHRARPRADRVLVQAQLEPHRRRRALPGRHRPRRPGRRPVPDPHQEGGRRAGQRAQGRGLRLDGANRGVTIPSTNYAWRAGEWIHLAMEWDSTAATNNVRAYLNGAPLVPTATANGVFTMLAETASGILRIGNRAVTPGFFNADGIMDEFRIYSRPPTEIAHGGLLSDSREQLANPADNAPLALQPIDGFNRGRYLFFGFDTKIRGLNVSLLTAGAGVADNQVQWFFWNGTDWQAVFPADGTNSFKQTGTIWWNPDWPGWTPYSMGGGPDLYYMMARLSPGRPTPTTPVERVIKTDVLLFQYCRDVTTANATFTFPVPPTTEVTLQSFSTRRGRRLGGARVADGVGASQPGVPPVSLGSSSGRALDAAHVVADSRARLLGGRPGVLVPRRGSRRTGRATSTGWRTWTRRRRRRRTGRCRRCRRPPRLHRLRKAAVAGVGGARGAARARPARPAPAGCSRLSGRRPRVK